LNPNTSEINVNLQFRSKNQNIVPKPGSHARLKQGLGLGSDWHVENDTDDWHVQRDEVRKLFWGELEVLSKSRLYERVLFNKKKGTSSQEGHNEPYPLMYILYINEKIHAIRIQ
jgi:hypothetical protein